MRKYLKLKKKYLLILLMLCEYYVPTASITKGASAAIASPSRQQINGLQTLTFGLPAPQQSQYEQVDVSDVLTTHHVAAQTR